MALLQGQRDPLWWPHRDLGGVGGREPAFVTPHLWVSACGPRGGGHNARQSPAGSVPSVARSAGPAQNKQRVWAGAASSLTRTEEWEAGQCPAGARAGSPPQQQAQCPRAGEGGRRGHGGSPAGASGASTAPALWTADLTFPWRASEPARSRLGGGPDLF